MDWNALASKLGGVSDSLTGRNYFAAKEAQAANNATANRQIDVGVAQNTENNQLKKILQQIQIAADLAAQDKEFGSRTNLLDMQQGFTGQQNQADRAQRKELNDADIASRRELTGLQNTGALERTMAPLNFENQLRDKAGFNTAIPEAMATQFKLPSGVTPAQLSILGPAAVQAATMGDPMMTKQFGNSFTQMEELRQMNELMQRIGKGNAQPGVRPSGAPPTRSVFTPGK